MADDIYVKPATEANRVKVATREIGGTHYPVYFGGAGDLNLDAWGTQKVTEGISLFHGLWSFDIPPSMWFVYENGTRVNPLASTDVTSSGGAAKLLTTASNTTLLMESRECPRYQPNRGHLISMAGWFPGKTNDGVRDFGLFTTENGAFFRLKADGLLYAVLRSGGAETEELINVNAIPSFDIEKNNIFDIQYQWRGAGNYKFFIGDPAVGLLKHVHTFDLLGTLTVVSMENPALPIAFMATRTTEDVEMNIGCADITSEGGKFNNTEQYKSAYAEAVSVGADQPVIVIRQPEQINSETNTRTITLARITVNCSKKSVFKVWTTGDPTNVIGATFKSRGGGSYVEHDSPDLDITAVRATSVTVANLNFITAVPVEATQRSPIDNPYRDRIEFPLVRGDYLIVTCTASTALADCVVEWGEQI